MIDDVRLPVDIERGASGGPGFKTTVITLASGSEQRNQEWSKARGSWDIGYGIQKLETLVTVYQFFLARRGRARGFRFRDWLDYQLVAEPVGTTDTATTRQIQKTYPDTANAYVRAITQPDATTLVVYVDNLATLAYTLDDDGILTFPGDPGGNVKVTCEFDVPARFDLDDLNVQLETFNAGAIPQIPVVELK